MDKRLDRSSRAVVLVLCLSVSMLGCGGNSAPPESSTGAIVLSLTATGGISLSSVSYVISGGPTARSGTIDVSQSNTISAVIGGLVSGGGYMVMLSATTDALDSCSGQAGPTTVVAGTTVPVAVVLTCHKKPGTGSIAINGTVDVCPSIDSLSASPAEVQVGHDVTVTAIASPDESAIGFPLAYTWTGATSSSGATATFHCATAGVFTVSLAVANGDPACLPTDAGASASISITCSGDDRSGEDVTAPTLTSLSFSPSSIDTTSASATVTVSVTVADDLSGVTFGEVRFISASAQRRECFFAMPPAGTTSFTGACDVGFPPFGEGGVWRIENVFLDDAVGNSRIIGTSDLQAAGVPTDLSVVSQQDVTAPTLTSLSFSPSNIDTTSASATVTVSVTVADDLSGVTFGEVRFISASAQRRECFFAMPPAGTTSFTGTCDVNFPPFGEGGVWRIENVFLDDAVGNSRIIGTSDLQAAGFSTDLTVNASGP